MNNNDLSLIEAGFPCHQVGAETTRERDTGLAPPTHRLHVWWARRPLTPSRAAIVASLLPAEADTDEFLKGLGIVKKQVVIDGVAWTLAGKILEAITQKENNEILPVTDKVRAAFVVERERRAQVRMLIHTLKKNDARLAKYHVLLDWEADNLDFSIKFLSSSNLTIKRTAANPAKVNERLALAKSEPVNDILGHSIKFDPEDLYGYNRAFTNDYTSTPSNLVVLDPTSGGGSIPFEALRLGHTVIANELNPVAATILHATLEYPAKFGHSLVVDIENWGDKLISTVDSEMAPFTPFSKIPSDEEQTLRHHLKNDPTHVDHFLMEYDHTGLLYCRQVTCPHCAGEAPLLNSSWLSKKGEKWGVAINTHRDKTVSFQPYRLEENYGPEGDDPNAASVTRGVGQCVHCQQAIDGDEIKAQARGESAHGRWQDRLYTVVAIRLQPKLDKHGEIQHYKSGARKGKIKTEKIRYFRAPNDSDLQALEEAERELQKRWDNWELDGLIPTERFPEGNDMRPVLYGMNRWCDMFTPRQLLGHLILIETLNQLKPRILAELGSERGKAVVTYLQFAIDKGVDYNSRQTRWEYTRSVVKGTFGRHDFSLKWTFGELVFSGPHSGAAWGLSQILDAYTGIAKLVDNRQKDESRPGSIRILNGSATQLDGVDDQSVDLVCMDPPYYDNVQYAELSDFYYVWQKRTLQDLYPDSFNRRATDKSLEAVANPARDGKQARQVYKKLMQEIFAECSRVLKNDGLMTVMFTHKAQEAWEALTKALIESGWTITSSFPVDSESAVGIHTKDKAAAASSIFITCRKRLNQPNFPATWRGFGGQGVQSQIEQAVREGLKQFEVLKLNPVDRMVASYGRALKILSENWPVLDGDEAVSPTRAMTEASRVVAEQEIERISKNHVRIEDLDAESAVAVMALGLWGHEPFAYDNALNLTRSLRVTLESKSAGYHFDQSVVGVATDTRRGSQSQRDFDGHFAPLAKKGSKLRLLSVTERSPRRLNNPQTVWDKLHGMILHYREGGSVQARHYLAQHAEQDRTTVLGLLQVYAAEIVETELRDEAEAIIFELHSSDYENAA